MSEQTDPLADLATRLRGLSLGNGSETLWATITEAVDAIDRLAAVVRASGAGLGGTSREDVLAAIDVGTEVARSTEITRGQGWMRERAAIADAVLALRPDPAPDDIADLRAEVVKMPREDWLRLRRAATDALAHFGHHHPLSRPLREALGLRQDGSEDPR